MNVYDKRDNKTAVKEEYLQGRISVEEYTKWLNAIQNTPKLIIPAKKEVFDPNLAFRKKKGRETFSDRLAAARDEDRAVSVAKAAKEYRKLSNNDDDDVPF